MFMLVAHFREADAPGGAVPARAAQPLAMLAAAPECRRLYFAHSTDSAARFVLVAEFDSAADYRRALSPWTMRSVVVPWLSSAELDSSEVNEVLLSAAHGVVAHHESIVPDPGR